MSEDYFKDEGGYEKPNHDARQEYAKELRAAINNWRMARLHDDDYQRMTCLETLMIMGQMGLKQKNAEELEKKFRNIESIFLRYKEDGHPQLYSIFIRELQSFEPRLYREIKHMLLPFNTDEDDENFAFSFEKSMNKGEK